MALGEGLYPSLQAFEITLRNALHDAISDQYGARWFNDPKVLRTDNGRKMIRSAEEKIVRARRQSIAVVREATDFPDRIVAANDLGFWTHLFNDPFEQGPGKPKPLWPAMATKVFPNAPRTFREHRRLGQRLDSIRRFRNRVFHHEPISRNPAMLNNHHSEIAETLRWLNQTVWQTIQQSDRFTLVFDRGVAFHIAEMEDFCRANNLEII